jgi:hypothetical protein
MIDADRRYYGLYEGLVVDSNDPESQGRVRIKVPQLFGNNVTDWVRASSGSIGQSKYPYGTFYTTADQALGVNTPTVINTSWVEADTSKTYLDGNRMYVEETGDYFVQFSAMFIKTNASSGTANMWFRKNGVDIPYSNTKITLAGNNSEITMTVSLVLDLDAGDYIQFVASASNTNTFISADSAGVGPAVPGIIATINLIGKWKPQPGTIVWVMFIAGDPNFPVWIGAE